MDGDQGAVNKFEHGEFSAGFNDLLQSAEKLLGKAETDAQTFLSAGLKTLAADAQTDFGQIATTAIGTAITAAGSGQTPPQILTAVLAAVEPTAIADAKTAGVDVENTILNTARIMLVGAQVSAPAPGAAS